jgi:hypothetical protein
MKKNVTIATINRYEESLPFRAFEAAGVAEGANSTAVVCRWSSTRMTRNPLDHQNKKVSPVETSTEFSSIFERGVHHWFDRG